MNYTFLLYQNAAAFALRTDPDEKKRIAFWLAWPPYIQALRDAGVLVDGAGLESAHTATTLRAQQDRHQVQDGPFADTKEQLAGFFIVDVPDLDSALEWAARIPAAPGSVIEVRPNSAACNGTGAQRAGTTDRSAGLKFSILCYESADSLAARSDPARRDNLFGAVSRYIEEMRDASVFAGGTGLELPHTATTIRSRNGERLVQDGPYADTKEQLGGLFVIDVPDEATAVAWAKRCPPEPGRVVELRAHLMQSN